MNELKEKIANIKFKIENELETFKHYSELKYTVNILLEILNSYKYDENDEESLKSYFMWLQDFYDSKIMVMNKSIIDNHNHSIFDNSDDIQTKRISDLEKEIETTFSNVEENYPEFSKYYKEQYQRIKNEYQEAYEETLSNIKKKYDMEIGLVERPFTKVYFGEEHHLPENPVLSLYMDIHSLTELFIHKLENLYQSCESIRIFCENDNKIKSILQKAYEVITDNKILEMIKEIENNYIEGIRKTINEQLVFLGPDVVQKRMTEACVKIEEMTNREININNILERIQMISLNTQNDEILELLNYVESNPQFEEGFYNILYVLIEKEKYLLYRYNEQPKLYNLLSEKVKNILERMFLERMDSFEEDSTTIIDRLKKYGYLYVHDEEYKDLFEHTLIENKPVYEIEERSYELYKKNTHRIGTYDSSENIKIVISNRENLHVTDENHIEPGDIVHTCRYAFNLDEKNGNVIFYKDGLLSKKCIAIDCKTGEKYEIPGFHTPTYFSKGNCIIYLGDHKWSVYNIYTQKYKEIGINYHCEVDYVNGFIVLIDLYSNVMIYDNELKPYRSFELPIIKYQGFKLYVNDGIMSFDIWSRSKKYSESVVIYYDYINMREIDRFTTTNHSEWIYSEGLYSYSDGDLAGYKKLNGEVFISPMYSNVRPFLGNIAQVTDEHHNDYIIDRSGILNKEFDCTLEGVKNLVDKYGKIQNKDFSWQEHHKDIEQFILPNLSIGKYEVFSIPHHDNYGCLAAHNNYLFEYDIPIIDIMYNQYEKAKKIVKQ